MGDFRLGLGVTAFALEPNLNTDTLSRFLDDVDRLEIPRENSRVIEVLAAHNPDSGFDLDDPQQGYLHWASQIRERFQQRGYEAIVCGFHPSGSPHMLSEKKEEVEHAVRRVFAMLDFAMRAEALSLIGPIHTEHKKLQGRPVEYLKEPLQRIQEHAHRVDVPVYVEMIRGLETHALNGIETGIPLIRDMNDAYLKLHWDTSHAIVHGDGDLAYEISELGEDLLGHVHISEVGRGPLKIQGQVYRQLPLVFKALQSFHYERIVSFEGFHYDLWPAVGREDTVQASLKSSEERRDLAFKETASSLGLMKHVFRHLEH